MIHDPSGSNQVDFFDAVREVGDTAELLFDEYQYSVLKKRGRMAITCTMQQ
jgi:hypothetical protein